MTAERWLPVPGWDGLYEVSDAGRVRSVPRVVVRGNGAAQTIRARVLRRNVGSHGYPRVNLARGGHVEQFLVHRLVLFAFVGPPPDGMETLHRNGRSTDCRLVNLHWGTSRENKLDVVRHGRHPSQRIAAAASR